MLTSRFSTMTQTERRFIPRGMASTGLLALGALALALAFGIGVATAALDPSVGSSSAAVPTDDARFVSQSVPSNLVPGQSTSVSITLTNTGTTTWTRDANYKLGSQNPQDNTTWTGSTRIYLAPGESVAPGQSKTFSFSITAPPSPGTYDFQWRMVRDGPGGMWFGQFTPNVRITVATPPTLNDARFVSQSVPSSLVPGQSTSVSITLTNTGTTTWTRDANYKLGSQNPQDNTTWTGSTRIYLAPGESVAPGQSKTFSFSITAPPSPGTYDFQWRMVRDGPGGMWFGQFTPNVRITVATPPTLNDARFVSQSVPSNLVPGQSTSVSITLTNTGTTTWTRDANYKLGSQNPQDNTTWTGSTRIYLAPGESVAPGQSKTFSFSITAPPSPGTYDFQWRMVRDGPGGMWFGQFTPNVAVRVARAGSGGNCPSANPEDDLPDDDALQDCLNRGGRVELLPGDPGYIIAKGIEITVDDTVLTSADAPTKARLVAHRDLFAPLLKAINRSGFTIEHVVFDGNKPNRTRLSSCRDGVVRLFGSNVTIGGGRRFTVRHIESRNAMCGTALGINGSDFEVAHSVIADNGFSRQQIPASVAQAPWSDGITLGRCEGGRIHHNTIRNNTDIGIVTGGGSRCVIEGNTITQTVVRAFAGLAIHFFDAETDGTHRESLFQNNTISSWRNGMDLGISVGMHPWRPDLETRFGAVIDNVVSGAVVNLAVDGYANGVVQRNQLRDPQGEFSHNINCPGFRANYTVAHATDVDLQPGWEAISFDQGKLCSKASKVPTYTPTSEGPTPTATPTPRPTPDRCRPRERGCVPTPMDDARIVGHTIPTSMIAGRSYEVSVTVLNTGRSTWTRNGGGPPDGSRGYKLGARDDDDLFYTTDTRVWLPDGAAVAPGERHTFHFTMVAPQQAGRYLTDWRMVHEGVRWFGGILSLDVRVRYAVPIPSSTPCAPGEACPPTPTPPTPSRWLPFPIRPGLWPASDEESREDDIDADGIPQITELRLAQHFFPTVWFDDGEDCTAPGGNPSVPPNLPGRLVFRLRPHPENPAYLAITYTLLYAEDCGDILPFDDHPGDAEPFAITLAPNPTCDLGYSIYAIRAWAHEGTAAENIDTRIVSRCDFGFSVDPTGRSDVVLAAENKHGNYLYDSTCDAGFGGLDNCDLDFTLGDVNAWVGFNAGEPNAPRHRDLGPLGFPGERMWSGRKFCGSLRRASNCPGPVESKFDLVAPAGPPIAPQTPTPTASAPPTATPTMGLPPEATPTPRPTDLPTPTAPPSRPWEHDDFDRLAGGPLAGQNGWFALQGSPIVVPQATGNALLVDAPPDVTIVVAKDVPDQSAGRHMFEFDVMVSGASEASLAKIEVQTSPNDGWDKKFQLYFGASMRVNYDRAGAAVTFLPSVPMGRWIHIRTEIDLGTGLLDIWVDGTLAASAVPMHPGPITSLGISGWDRPGNVYLEDLIGAPY